MHCLYVTLEEERYFFIGITYITEYNSEYKNTDKLTFGEHQQLLGVNCNSRYVISDSKHP